MRIKERWCSAFVLAIALGLAPVAAQSQSSTTVGVTTRNFEVVSVEGNNLVVRDEKGAQELTVPDDFRFTVDGKKMSVKELKPGMKGTAMITTTTKVSPVTLTEIKTGTVIRATEYSMYVRTPDGVKHFKQAQLDDRGIQIVKEGRVVRIRDMKQGDEITATIVSQMPPVVMTEKEVQATLAQPASAPAAAPAPAPAAAPAAPQAAAPAPAPMQTADATPATAPPASSPAPVTAAPQPAPAADGTPWFWYLVIAIVVVLLWFFVFRKKEKS